MGAVSIHARAWAGIIHVLTVDRQRWVNVASLNRRNAVLEADAIVRVVAESDPTFINQGGDPVCTYCEIALDAPTPKHAPTCAWQRARDFVEKEK